ncbi:MAG: rhomboid family intramembrane serine protease [Sterolibacterium sp.]|nr:rhomboid family intramembrane serine protease [Sterolibacterium sp.]
MFAHLPPLTRRLIIANILVFIAQALLGPQLVVWFGLWPLPMPGFAGYPAFLPWQLVSYGFLHGGLGHLLFNMFALYMFGSELERVFGSRRLFNLYFASIVAGGLTQLLVLSQTASVPVPTIGASAGVFGLLLAFGLFFPRRTLVLLFPPIPLPAWLFVTLYGLLELSLGVFSSQSGVAHFAHLGGMFGAWLMIRRWRRR